MTCDPLFSNVVLLAHFDGGNNVGAYVDSSSYGRAIVQNGTLLQSNAVTLFSSPSSAHFPNIGTGDLTTLADSTVPELSIRFANGDFTIEGWIYPTNTTATGYLWLQGLATYNLSTGATGGNIYPGASVSYYVSGFSGTTSSFSLGGAAFTAIAANQWSHLCFERVGTTYSLYLNGVLIDSIVDAHNPVPFPPASSNAQIGAIPGNTYFIGYIDEFRFTNGAFRYGAPFTPPVAVFPGACVPPTIDVQPTNQTGVVGGTATFSVTAHGDGLAYQWFLNGSPILGANSASFTTPPLTLGMSGQNYQVQITGTIAPPATSALVVLTVIGQPQNGYINQFLDEQIFPLTFGRKLFFEEFVYYPMRPVEDGVDLAPAVPNMIINRYKQQPTETRKRGVDFTLFCQPGEFIVGISAAVVTPTTVPPVVVTNVILDPDTQQKFAYTVAGGVDGTEYTIQFTVTFNTGNVQTEQVVFMIALFAESQFP